MSTSIGVGASPQGAPIGRVTRDLRFVELAMLLFVGLACLDTVLDEEAKVFFPYVTAAVCFGLVGYHVLAFGHFNVNRMAALLAALLGCVGVATFAISRFVTETDNSYAAALVPFLVFALPAITPDIEYDFPRLRRWTMRLFAFAALMLVLAQTFQDGPIFKTGTHESSYVFVFILAFGVIFRSLRYMVLGLALSVAFLFLRPTSTLFAALVLAALLLLIRQMAGRASFRAAAIGVAYFFAVSNVLYVVDFEFISFFFEIEETVKNLLIGGSSNTEFRTAVLTVARDDLHDHGILFGKFFTGEINAFVYNRIPWFGEFAPIHSDFVTILVQGGLVGYLVFSAVFLIWQHMWARAARLNEALGNAPAASYFDLIALCQVVFMLFIDFNPLLANIERVAFFYALVLPAFFGAYRLLSLYRLRAEPMDADAGP